MLGAAIPSLLQMIAAGMIGLPLYGCGPAPIGQGVNVGYSGPYPDGDAQGVIKEDLKGWTYSDKDGVLGGGRWTVGGFAVIPNPRSPSWKGPVICLDQGDRSEYIPVETNADVADFYRRVTGKAHPILPASPLSDSYRRAMKLQ